MNNVCSLLSCCSNLLLSHTFHCLFPHCSDEDVFFRFSEDDRDIASTQYVLPCIILGEDVEDFSFCPKASIEALWREFHFIDGFAPHLVIFGDAFDPVKSRALSGVVY